MTTNKFTGPENYEEPAACLDFDSFSFSMAIAYLHEL